MIHQPAADPIDSPSTPLNVAVRQAVLCLSLGIAFVSPAQAAEPLIAAHQIDVHAGTLDNALIQLSRATGLNIAFDQHILAGKNSKGLHGSFSPSAALNQLLAGSNLHAVLQTDGGYVIVPALQGSALQLGATAITGEVLGATTEGTHSYTSGAVSIGRTAHSLKETPQAVSVVTSQQIQDQNLTSLTDVLKNTTGITLFEGTNIHSRYLSRGFEITNMRVDGGANVRSAGDAMASIDMAMYDHVEVLRGVDGLYAGAGEPGGSINLVRKKPTEQLQTKFLAQTGSWNANRSDLDISGPIAFDGKLRGRTVLSYEDKDYFYDSDGADNKLFYGVLEADITDGLMVTLGASRILFDTAYQGYGLPRSNTGESLGLSRSTYLSGKDDKLSRATNSIFLEATQALTEQWALNLSAIYSEFDQQRGNYFFNGAVDAQTGAGVSGAWTSYDETFRDISFDANLKGFWELFGREHEIIVGGDYKYLNQNINGSNAARIKIPDIYTFDADDYTRQPPINAIKSVNRSEQTGLYSSLNLRLTDATRLIVGGRLSNFEYKYQNNNQNLITGATSSSLTTYKDNQVFTPYGAVTHDIAENWTVYTSVAEIYKSQANSFKGPQPGTPLDPITGINYELGVKGELFDGRLNTMAALYYTKRNGEAVVDARYPLSSGTSGERCCYLDDGRVVSKGVELELSGELRPRLEGSIGYTLNFNENKVTGASYNSLTPKHLLKLNMAYQMPGLFSALRLGGGVTAQSESYVSGAAYLRDVEGNVTSNSVDYKFTQQGYALWNAFAVYQVSRQWSVAANANNIFNKEYYSSVGDLTYGNFYGPPRNYTLTLRGDF